MKKPIMWLQGKENMAMPCGIRAWYGEICHGLEAYAEMNLCNVKCPIFQSKGNERGKSKFG